MYLPQNHASSNLVPTTPLDDPLYKRIAWRIVPVLMIAYVVAYIDRVNVGFAKLQMAGALGFSDAIFGLGAGLMFVGYCLFEIPSNLLLKKMGVRKTFLRIMLLWGLTTVAIMFVKTPTQFYVARFFLGVFEAGLFPGAILYFTYWFPEERRGRIIGLFMSGGLIGNVLAGPISGATMKYLDGVGGLGGWQWLYLTQGLPAVILGFVAYWWLCDTPREAHWLNAEEKKTILSQVGTVSADHPASMGQIFHALKDWRFCGFVLIDFLIIGGAYTMVFWVPTLIKSWGVADMATIGLLSGIPSIAGVLGIILVCRHSDIKQERRWHFAVMALLAAVGLWLTTVVQGNLVASLIALTVATLGIAVSTPLLVTTTTENLKPEMRAIGIPLLTSLGILGGFVSPAVTGYINTTTGNPIYSMYLVIGLFVAAAALMLVVAPRGIAKPV
ncbi:MAG: MFS transporter [Hylemonella sp.]|nr:MFS transporter [Hylemonella sp.]